MRARILDHILGQKKDVVGKKKTGKFESAMQSTVLHQCLSPAFDNLIMVTYIVDRETE